MTVTPIASHRKSPRDHRRLPRRASVERRLHRREAARRGGEGRQAVPHFGEIEVARRRRSQSVQGAGGHEPDRCQRQRHAHRRLPAGASDRRRRAHAVLQDRPAQARRRDDRGEDLPAVRAQEQDGSGRHPRRKAHRGDGQSVRHRGHRLLPPDGEAGDRDRRLRRERT